VAIQLDEYEIRVLGVLIEKALTQPNSYPMTLNAILLGANQKQNRDPVVDFTDGQISGAVHRLQHKELVKQAPPAVTARANRYEHCVVEKLGWDRRQQAVMAELMLRGRQTAGELRSRASRMTQIPDLSSVSHILQELSSADPPLVQELTREPGRSVTRFKHLIGAELAAQAQKPPIQSREAPTAPPSRPFTVDTPAPQPHGGPQAALIERLALLEERVEALERQMRERQS